MKATGNKIGSSNKDPQIRISHDTIYTFGESSIEVDFLRADISLKDHPFARIEDSARRGDDPLK